MASSVAAVDELTEMLLAKALPAAKKELAALTEFAKAAGYEEDKLDNWDVRDALTIDRWPTPMAPMPPRPPLFTPSRFNRCR